MAKLIVISGGTHSVHELGPEGATIGRAQDNVISLDDPNCSRHHCKVEYLQNAWRIVDCGSFNGTYVNNVMIDAAFLKPGDKIQIGGTIAYFVATDGDLPAPSAPPPLPEEAAETTRFTGALDTTAAAGRLSDQNVATLLEVMKAVNSELDQEKLLELIMDHAIQLIGAERGFVVMKDEESPRGFRFAVARNIDHEEVEKPEFNVSSSIIKKVLETGEPILSSNAQDDYGQFLSIVDLELRSLLCVPLSTKEKILGTLYLDSRLADSEFGEDSVNLLQAFADQAGVAIENARLVAEVRDKERIEQELRIASQIQSGLIPKQVPQVPGLEILGYMETAKEIGGDYYDYVHAPDDPNSCYVTIGDVSGKGVGAGLVMVMTRAILHTTIGNYHDTHSILCQTNRNLKKDLKPGMFMSMSLWKWDGARQRLTFTSGGGEKPIIYRAATGMVEVLNPGGIVLGVMPDVSKLLKEHECPLEPGDMVVLYTDGITEAMNPAHEEFTLQRLQEAVMAFGHQPVERFIQSVVRCVKEFTAGAEQHDDITLVVMRRT